MKKLKVDREYPSLSILCEMYGAAEDPNGLCGYYGTFGTKACEEYNFACQELGHRLHTALEDYELKRIGHLDDPREQAMFTMVADWTDQTGMKSVDCGFSENGKAIEVVLNSSILGYSCRADRVVTFGSDKTKWILDYKTSSSLSDKYKMQLAGYALGWFEKTGEWLDQGVLVRVEKSPKKKQQLEILEVHNLHEWLEPLVLTRQLWDFINRKGIHAPTGIPEKTLVNNSAAA